MQEVRLIIFFIMAFLIGMVPVGATDLNKAKGTVDNIRAADPPQVSTAAKPSPVGQPVSDYKPRGPSVHAAAPPVPKNYNPRNDPAVQKGYDQHQKAHGR